MRREQVAVVKVSGDISAAVGRALHLLGGLDVKPGGRVVVKPNLCHASPPETGRTTDSRVVEALVDHFLSAGAGEVAVVESDSYGKSASQAFKVAGYTRLAEKPGVRLVNLSKEATRPRRLGGRFFKEFPVPEILEGYSLLASAAKLKTSLVERVSGAYKNQFGLIPQREKRPFHPYLNEVLYDLNSLFPPQLCVIDGITAMEGCGPTDGLPKTMNVIIAGWAPLPVDGIASALMGIDPRESPHLKYAHENGLGEIDEDRIEVLGEGSEGLRQSFAFIPEEAYRRIRQGLRLGRYWPPLRNLGILLFTWGNYKAGKEFSTRAQRQKESGESHSPLFYARKALWTRSWNV